jgi:hypothetical protein
MDMVDVSRDKSQGRKSDVAAGKIPVVIIDDSAIDNSNGLILGGLGNIVASSKIILEISDKKVSS